MSFTVYVFSGLLGAALASFLNAAVFRLFKQMPIINDRSKCVHCAVQLRWWQLIPGVSYLVLGGKCASCKKIIPFDYFAVEIIMAGLFIFLAYWHGLAVLPALTLPLMLVVIRDLIIVSVLAFLFLFDLKYYLLPDLVTIPSLVVIFVLQLILGVSLLSLILGAVIGAGFFLFQYLISKGKWIGDGDIRMGALMGVILSWPLILVGLFLSYLLGAVVALPLLMQKKKHMQSKIPFGTFLAVGTLVTLFFGQSLLDWYLKFL